MPNHFVVVGLGAIRYPKDEALADVFDPSRIEEIKDKNLCELAYPIPEELKSIVASSSPHRYVHKHTGEILQSANGVVDCDKPDDWECVPLTQEQKKDLQQKYGATEWYSWCRQNWGTKWGTYGTSARILAGDGYPVLICFQCAWGPPFFATMQKIEEYLRSEYGVDSIKWSGHDPMDGSVHHLFVQE